MKTGNQISENCEAEKKFAKVPQDVFFDILRIFTSNKIKFRIAAIKERENVAVVEFIFYPGVSKYEQVQKGVKTILDGYNNYMRGISGEEYQIIESEED